MSISQNGNVVYYKMELRDPEPLLWNHLNEDLHVESFNTESFIKPNDHYGSTIFKFRAVVKKNGENGTKTMELVAKMLPPTDEQRKFFGIDYTFKKETFVYKELVPLYRRLYNRKQFDITPEFYGSRLSLRPDADVVDEDAVMLMEDLGVKGYYMMDRRKGLDNMHMKSAIIALSKFHAAGMSIKHKNPEFLYTVQKYMQPLTVDKAIMRPYVANVYETLKNDSVTGQYYSRFQASLISDDLDKTYCHPMDPKNPWSSIIHSDFWVNNVLFHKDENYNIDDAKIVDFQLSYIASPLLDIVFLLCTSMATMSIENFDEMLEFYRINMLENLEDLGYDAGLFKTKSFEERLKIDAPKELQHIILMTNVLERKADENVRTSPLSEPCLRRFRSILQIYANKKWI